jgi:hypothetical protein
MSIKGTEGMSHTDIEQAIAGGGKFVTYQYCISIILMTFRRSSDVYFIKPGEGGKGIGFTLLTVFFGWWGIPWGPIYSIGSIVTNLGGGKDVTQEICSLNGLSLGY